MKQTEVTQAEWSAEGLTNRARTTNGEADCVGATCPAGRVSWYDALAFANKLSVKAGLKECYELSGCVGSLDSEVRCEDAGTVGPSLFECSGFRIPTEAEWEYAARAGTTTAFYSGEIVAQTDPYACSKQVALDSIAWYCGNSDKTTHPVGLKQPNAWGLFDMAGNAFELTSDRFDGLGYGVAARVDPGSRIEPGLTMPARGGFAWGWAFIERSASHLEFGRVGGMPGSGLRLVRRAD